MNANDIETIYNAKDFLAKNPEVVDTLIISLISNDSTRDHTLKTLESIKNNQNPDDTIYFWSGNVRYVMSNSEFNEIAREARANQKVRAIKAFRFATGSSLKEAKDAIEAWMADNM